MAMASLSCAKATATTWPYPTEGPRPDTWLFTHRGCLLP